MPEKKQKTIIVLGIDTKIGRMFHNIPGVIGIKKSDFDTRNCKLFDPLDVLINCISLEEGFPSNIYDVNIVGNERMQNRARLDNAHYIRISTSRVRNGRGDGTMFGNTMALSERHINYDKATIIRKPTKALIENVIYNGIYGLV